MNAILGPLMILAEGQVGQGAEREEYESECDQIRHDARDELDVRDNLGSPTVWAIEFGGTVPEHGMDRT